MSPHSPIAQARLLVAQFDKVGDRAADWEQAAARHPQLALAFASRYATDDPQHAEKLLRTAAEMSHDAQAYLQLAAVYEKQGDEGRWLATLKEFLKQPTYGLEHTQVNIKIADHFIEKGQWCAGQDVCRKRRPIGFGAGLYKAAAVDEALRLWSKAEMYYQAVSTRYRGENLAWYYFCCARGTAAKRQPAAWPQST